MNRRMIISTVGLMLLAEAGLLLLPLAVGLLYGEESVRATLLTIGIAVAAGLLLYLPARTKNRVIYAREGFLTVALCWLTVSAVGALPFFLSGQIPNYIDAFFEAVSGFTTTGASIMDGAQIESMSKGLLFWRSFTHWVGGMGVLVFIMALIPNLSERSIHIMRAEMPGPVVGKQLPRARDTAKILYIIYVGMTLVEIVLLCAGVISFLLKEGNTGALGVADQPAAAASYRLTKQAGAPPGLIPATEGRQTL